MESFQLQSSGQRTAMEREKEDVRWEITEPRLSKFVRGKFSPKERAVKVKWKGKKTLNLLDFCRNSLAESAVDSIQERIVDLAHRRRRRQVQRELHAHGEWTLFLCVWWNRVQPVLTKIKGERDSSYAIHKTNTVVRAWRKERERERDECRGWPKFNCKSSRTFVDWHNSKCVHSVDACWLVNRKRHLLWLRIRFIPLNSVPLTLQCHCQMKRMRMRMERKRERIKQSKGKGKFRN